MGTVHVHVHCISLCACDSVCHMYCGQYSDINTCACIIICTCTCHCVSQWGETALMMAAQWGYSDTVTVLLEAGANANIQNHVSAHLVSKTSCTCTESEMYSPLSHSLQLDRGLRWLLSP